MDYGVRVETVAQRPTAVVKATTTWAEFPSQWQPMLDEVWSVARGGRNVMLYRDIPNGLAVEIGVEMAEPFESSGRVVSSALPGGEIATTVHTGPPDRIKDAHDAVRSWCRNSGRHPAGPRWEIYGHVAEGGTDFDVTVCHLLG